MPTTLPGMKSTTSVQGRDIKKQGYPIRVCELLAGVDGPYYIARTSVHAPKEIIKTERAIKNAFVNQIENKGFSLIEILSMCPTNWGMTPPEAMDWLQNNSRGLSGAFLPDCLLEIVYAMDSAFGVCQPEAAVVAMT